MSNLFKRNPIKQLTKAVPKSLYLLTLIFCISCMGMVEAIPTITNYAYADSGNVLGTITNNVTYNQDGYYNFDGLNNNYINIGFLGFNSTSNQKICANFSTNNNAIAGYILGRTYGSSDGSRSGSLIAMNPGIFRYYVLNQTTGYSLDYSGMLSNVWYKLCGEKNSTHINLYLNDVLVNSTLFYGNMSNGTGAGFIGAQGLNSATFNGSIKDVLIYRENSLIINFSFKDAGLLRISGTGDVNMSWLNLNVFDKNKINLSGVGEYTLYAILNISSSTLNLSLTNLDVNKIKLFSGRYYSSITSSAFNIVNISNVLFESTNGSDFDIDFSNGRAYIFLDGNNGGSTYISNSNFSYLGFAEDYYWGLEFFHSPNSLILNNIMHDMAGGIISRVSNNSVIKNNLIYDIYGNFTSISKGIDVISSQNNIIDGNMVYNVRNLISGFAQESVGIHSYNRADNIVIKNNVVYNADIGSDVYMNTTNVFYLNNTIYNSTNDCLRVERTGINVLIQDNILFNCGMNGINDAIHIFSVDGENENENITIFHNFINSSFNGIIIHSGSNITIINNTLYDFLDLPLEQFGVTLFNGSNNLVSYNVFKNLEIGIRLMFQNYTTISYNSFFNNSFDDIEIYHSSYNTFLNKNSVNKFMNREIINQQVNYFELSNALLTNGTSICNGSSSNLALNTGNLNITLSPGEECWMLDNFHTNNYTDYNRLISSLGQTSVDSLYSTYGWTIPTRYTADLQTSCTAMQNAFSDILPWLGIILFVLAAGVILTIIQLGGFELNLFPIVIMIFSVGFLIIMTIVIIGGILGC